MKHSALVISALAALLLAAGDAFAAAPKDTSAPAAPPTMEDEDIVVLGLPEGDAPRFAMLQEGGAPGERREIRREVVIAEGDEEGGGRDPEEMRETLRLWRFHKLRQELHLTDAQSDAILKADERKAEREKALRERGRAAMDELRAALDAKASEGTLRRHMDELEAVRRDRQKAGDEHMAELKKVLSVEQQARFLLFEKQSRERMKKMIMDRRERREGEAPEAPRPPRRER